ncbi:DUF3877 family protein [Anaerosporobacter sp.]|uniref:DUF3877 family protein n=1 Tax=Anaerosporobacter sp. TaxID=1872529 RepID=UPI00286F26DA|nr:DUF3877 family protein [Anaerosporobacter sp.]
MESKMAREAAYQLLEKNIIDTIHEWQVKLGYTEEMIRIYYNRDSLEHLVKLPLPTVVEAKAFLIEWRETAEHFGKIRLSNKEERFCIGIPAEGTKYIYELKKRSTFLIDLMKILKESDCTIEHVMEVFKKQSEDIICEHVEGEEFDYVIYYADETMDAFRYCFSFGEMGAFYHRFSAYDFETIH